MTPEEEEEVRTLLIRHKDRIIKDLSSTDLLTVLVKNSVITPLEEELLMLKNVNKNKKLIGDKLKLNSLNKNKLKNSLNNKNNIEQNQKFLLQTQQQQQKSLTTTSVTSITDGIITTSTATTAAAATTTSSSQSSSIGTLYQQQQYNSSCDNTTSSNSSPSGGGGVGVGCVGGISGNINSAGGSIGGTIGINNYKSVSSVIDDNSDSINNSNNIGYNNINNSSICSNNSIAGSIGISGIINYMDDADNISNTNNSSLATIHNDDTTIIDDCIADIDDNDDNNINNKIINNCDIDNNGKKLIKINNFKKYNNTKKIITDLDDDDNDHDDDDVNDGNDIDINSDDHNKLQKHQQKRNNQSLQQKQQQQHQNIISGDDDIDTTADIDDLTSCSENLINLENQCVKLIDIIAKNGFQRFKQFCYAIENECPQLIEDLINDRLKNEVNTTNIHQSNEEKIKADESENSEKDKDSEHSRRSTSYSGSTTTNSMPIAAPRRKSLMNVPPPPPPNITKHQPLIHTVSAGPIIQTYQTQPKKILQSSPILNKYPISDINSIITQSQKNENQIQSYYQSPQSTAVVVNSSSNNYSSLLCHSSQGTSSPAVVRKREKLLHRFSDAATLGRKLKKKKNSRTCHSMTEAIELLADPVIEDDFFGDRTTWEYHTVSVTRVPGYGFGIAVSGGRDNPHFANGDPSIAVSDVLKGGPAEDRLQVNDRIISVNGVSLENVEYATAVQVLRDSGNTVTLVVKRRVPINTSHQHTHSMSSVGLTSGSGMGAGNLASPVQSSPPLLPNVTPGQPIKVVLTKASKKEDFGIVLGCRLFIKEISSKARDQLIANGYSLQEGDVVTRIHNTNCNDSMSMKEAKKIIDGCKERLNLVVLRDITNQASILNSNNNINNNLNNSGVQNSNLYSHAQQISNCSNNLDDPYLGGANYSSQNLYVQPPTRGAASSIPSSSGLTGDEKSNLTPRGRSRGPIMDVSQLSQLDRPSTPPGSASRRQNIDEPPRPPPPRGSSGAMTGAEDFYSSRRQLYEEDPLQRSRQSAEPRFISFQKEGSVGIRLTGGNEAGIFVTAVQPGSPASLQGLTPGDKILKVNDMDMHGVTREEAVLFLLSLQDRIDLIVQHCKDEYDEVVANQRGDSFHIKTHFHCENPSKGEMAFKAGDVFRVIDTLHNGVVGSWQVLKIGRGHQEMQRGVIPNKSRAEELATAQFNATKKEMNASESRGNFFRRRRSSHRRSKSLSRENWDDVVFSDAISKFPAYERVVLRHPGFVRPVVLFGPVSDIAREKLTKDFPDKFTAPLQDDDKTNAKCRIVRLSNIRDIMDRGKHALLDITPNAVDRLNYAQFYPIVLFLKADTKHTVKQLRQGIPKSAHKSSKKLLEQCQKLEKVWSHIFSTTITLTDTESWYRKLRESIDLQQSGAVWMSESKPVESLSDDFLFPMTTSRLSYASSPESDLELSPGPSASLSLGNLPQLVKSSSDPSIATNQDNLDRDRDIGEGLPPPYTNPYDHTNPPQNRRTSAIDNKFGFGATNSGGLTNSVSGIQNSSSLSPEISNRPQSLYGINAPDLPPRIDRGVKPPGTSNGTTTSTNGILSLNSGTPSRTSSSGGTIGRTAQERLFGNKQPSGTTSSTTTTGQISSNLDDSHQDEYITRNNTDSIERTQNSLERHRIMDPSGIRNVKQQQLVAQNGSYDSVSSYDSYNTTQLSMQNLRLGPNAPDDLKSVPTTNRPPPPVGPNGTEYSRGLHNHSRSFGNANDLNRQNSPGRPGYHEVGSPRNIDARNSQSGINHPQRPSNLILDNSPRKPILETKTDYGKYSRNNSASQADYASKIGKGSAMNGNGGQQQQQHQQQQQQQQQMSSQSLNGNGINNIMGNTPFKPVPPPKPKNYRPPIQQSGSNGQMTNSGHWDNGEPGSPRSPNGFFYPPTPSHYHHNQASGSPHHSNGNGTTQQAIHAYGHYNAGQQQQQQQQQQQAYQQTNGYNSGYGGQYSHRGPPPPPIGIMPHLTPERHALDLAGSREQRGSAFELYRKPQIGAAGHHHNMSDLEPYDQRYYYENNQQMHHQQSSSSGSSHQMIYSNEMNDPNYRHFYANNSNGTPPPLPPPLPPPKTKKKSVLKSPLAALKNAFIKSTKPLRRMNSMVEPERVAIKPCIRRQYSMNERNMNRVHYPEDGYPPYATQPLPRQHLHQLQQQQQQQQQQSLPYPTSSVQQHYNAAMKQYHEPYYPNDGMLNSTYQNLESEDIYTNSMRRLRERQQMQQQQELDDLYANRALIDLERRQADSGRYSSSGRRIIRRHSTADRTGSQRPVIMQRVTYDPDDIYQSRHGAYMLQERRAPGSEVMVRRRFYSSDHSDEPTYQSRREMHRSHLYQSKKEMQERIAQGKREIEREFSPPQSSSQSEKDDKSDRESMYQSRKEVRESLKSRSQLREQIYQTRRDTLESMAEPTYVSKRDIVKHEPIYETKEENTSKENITDERKTEEKVETENENCNSDETTHSDLQRSNDTVVENTITQENNNSLTTKAPLAFTEDDPEDDLEDINDKIKKLDLDLQSVKSNSNNNSSNNTPRDENKKQSTPLTPSRDGRPPFHISNILKRTAPPPTLPPIQSANDPTCDLSISRTSIETHYTSQASLPVGPPNATSTPYASDMSLPIAGPVPIPSTNVKLQQPLQQQKQSQQQQHTANTSISLSPAASSSSPIKPNIIGATGTTFPIIPREPSTTHGVFDENGGTLCDNVWNVSLIIPSGAIAPGVKQEVYFTVTDPRMSQTVGGPPLDMENGETMLSPLVMCGPQGLEFNVPVTLNIPHCAGRTASLGLALKATDSEKNLHTEWDNIDLPSNTAAHTVSVKVDHF